MDAKIIGDIIVHAFVAVVLTVPGLAMWWATRGVDKAKSSNNSN